MTHITQRTVLRTFVWTKILFYTGKIMRIPAVVSQRKMHCREGYPKMHFAVGGLYHVRGDLLLTEMTTVPYGSTLVLATNAMSVVHCNVIKWNYSG